MASTLQPKLTLQHWRSDLTGGFTAAVVALPLALAFGVASGAGALAGLYGAIVLGFLAALLGGAGNPGLWSHLVDYRWIKPLRSKL